MFVSDFHPPIRYRPRRAAPRSRGTIDLPIKRKLNGNGEGETCPSPSPSVGIGRNDRRAGRPRAFGVRAGGTHNLAYQRTYLKVARVRLELTSKGL
jgi:hypothetical protein